jgi:hypothetical protein
VYVISELRILSFVLYYVENKQFFFGCVQAKFLATYHPSKDAVGIDQVRFSRQARQAVHSS